ncbi:hypothetical protein LH464_16625 [Neorhizobium sp. T786]|nr:hypothetical protein [Neorhizobium xiangyangii]MCB5204094.1 hypothetical protein [Neorhizobium xiangyangii]
MPYHRVHTRLARSLFIFSITAASLQLFPTAPVLAQDNPFSQFPIVIACKFKDTYHAYYFSRIGPDGVATYVASDRIAGTISIKGRAAAIGSDGGGNCEGRTLQELRESGQAHDLPAEKAP